MVVHFDAGLDRTLGLLVQVSGAAVPELRHIEHGIEYRWRIARRSLPAVADGGFLVIVATHGQVMAAVAGENLAGRQARLEPKHAAQLDFFWSQRVVFELGRLFWNGGEKVIGLLD